jgi:hypothetical protein
LHASHRVRQVGAAPPHFIILSQSPSHKTEKTDTIFRIHSMSPPCMEEEHGESSADESELLPQQHMTMAGVSLSAPCQCPSFIAAEEDRGASATNFSNARPEAPQFSLRSAIAPGRAYNNGSGSDQRVIAQDGMEYQHKSSLRMLHHPSHIIVLDLTTQHHHWIPNPLRNESNISRRGIKEQTPPRGTRGAAFQRRSRCHALGEACFPTQRTAIQACALQKEGSRRSG